MTEVQSTYGIIGYPVQHSLSPLMHNTAFKELGFAAVYKIFSLREDQLDGFFAELRSEESPIFGFNVTIPYKEKVIAFMDQLTPFAEKAMAVNTVVINPDRKFIGYNTDGPGFLAHLAELNCNVKGKRIALLGAGGTTRALLTALCLLPEKPESIRLCNRTREKAEVLVGDLAERFDVSLINIVSTVDDLKIEFSDILINTTSVGLKDDDPCLVDPELLHADMLVYDVIYLPQGTPLLQSAREKGAETANGLGMLFYQGVLAFQHWADVQLDSHVKDKMRKSLELGKVL